MQTIFSQTLASVVEMWMSVVFIAAAFLVCGFRPQHIVVAQLFRRACMLFAASLLVGPIANLVLHFDNVDSLGQPTSTPSSMLTIAMAALASRSLFALAFVDAIRSMLPRG